MATNEFWLLDSVLEMRHPLSMLTSEQVESWFGRPAHGMTRDELLGLLGELFARGDLCASTDERGDFVPAEAELAAALDGGADADYGLTEAGGARWEALARPDWNRFMDEVYGDDSAGAITGRALGGQYAGEITCADRVHLDQYLQGVVYNGFLPHPETVQVETLTPWQALYWKVLPVGERVTFQCLRVKPVAEEEVPAWFREMKIWYKRPDEKP